MIIHNTVISARRPRSSERASPGMFFFAHHAGVEQAPGPGWSSSGPATGGRSAIQGGCSPGVDLSAGRGRLAGRAPESGRGLRRRAAAAARVRRGRGAEVAAAGRARLRSGAAAARRRRFLREGDAREAVPQAWWAGDGPSPPAFLNRMSFHDGLSPFPCTLERPRRRSRRSGMRHGVPRR